MIMTARHWASLVLLVISVWLISSAYFVNVEYADGYGLIANTKALLGLKPSDLYIQNFPEYYVERMPLNSFVLIPAELLKTYVGLSELDVRIHHLLFSLIHIGYIFITYQLLRHYFNDELVILITFLTTIPSFIFFSYAPFLSADIYPGVIFLFMLLQARHFNSSPNWQSWWLLVVLGTCSVLIKHMYAIFWLVIICVYGISLLYTKRYKTMLWLCSGAVLSAALSWLILSAVLLKWDPQAPIPLLLPYYQILAITKQHPSGAYIAWPWWLYFRNFPIGYGVLTTLLIVPGIVIALRYKNSLLQPIALAWIIAFLFMLFTPYREIRYLAFLAPLSCFLIVSPIQFLLQHKKLWAITVVLLLIFDLGRSTIEAAIVYNDFFASDPIVNFLRVINATANTKRPIIMPISLSFTSQAFSPLVGDQFHRIFHVHLSIITRFYPNANITGIETNRELIEKPSELPNNTILLLATNVLRRAVGEQSHYFVRDNIQVAAFREMVTYNKTNNGYVSVTNDSRDFLIVYKDKMTNKMEFASLSNLLSSDIVSKLGFAFTDKLEIYGFRVTALCKLDKCNFFM